MKYYITFSRLIFISLLLALTVACNSDSDENSSQSSQSSTSASVLGSDTSTETEQINNSADDPSTTATEAAFAKPNVYSVNQIGDSIEVFWDPVSAKEFRVIIWPENDLPQIFVTTSFEFSTPEIMSSGEHIILVEAYDELGNSLFSDPSALELL